MISFNCADCHAPHSRPDADAGTWIVCDCGTKIRVPSPPSYVPPGSPPPPPPEDGEDDEYEDEPETVRVYFGGGDVSWAACLIPILAVFLGPLGIICLCLLQRITK